MKRPRRIEITKMLFSPGTIVATPGAVAACTREYMVTLLVRHLAGDWGNQCAEDAKVNEDALKYGGRIASSYPIDPFKPAKDHGANVLWVITEADRSTTTFLLPDEY